MVVDGLSLLSVTYLFSLKQHTFLAMLHVKCKIIYVLHHKHNKHKKITKYHMLALILNVTTCGIIKRGF